MRTTLHWCSVKRGAMLLITMMLVGTWSMAQNSRVSDPSLNDANYDSQKLARHTQVRSTNNSSGVRPVGNDNVDRQSLAAPLTKATSTCFIPLDASYTSVPRNDDGSFGPIALPFTFDLYGTSYTQVWINTNGNLTFTGSYSTYSASGFPFSQPMVAPFWGDVDTRNTAGGQIHYKLSATNLIVTWDNVGYYNQAVDKLNEFQVVISDGVDPITGLGQNVCFNYGDMQWTTGSASSGVNGFGGTPATVGVNKGNSVDFYQLGRFNLNSAVYDGPGGNPDGINYLDQQCYCSQVSSAVNIAPIANNFPTDTIQIDCGETYNLDFSFIPPEVNQTVSTTVNVNGACGTTFTSTSGSLSDINFSLLGQQCNEGVNTITFTATDNGTPVESTTVTLYVEVGTCCDLTASSTGQDESCANQSDGSISVSTTGGMAPLSYSINGGATYSGSPNFTGLATGVYVVVAQDVNGCESVPQTITISGPTQLTSSSSATAILCNGGSSIVTVSGSGGTPSYSGTGTFTIGVGTHTYTITDANGCTSSTTVTIAEPSLLVSSASSTSIDCNGGTSTVTVSATGGTAPYSSTGTYIVSAGTHSYDVTDANGCVDNVSITISEPTSLVLSISATEILCNGETTDITVSATGGTAPYTGDGVYTGSAGTYTYDVTDANGCTETVSITVTEPTQLTASATATEILCNGETTDITVVASGGTAPYTGDLVYTELAGTHTYTVTDSKGCSIDVTITVVEPTQLAMNISSPSIDCFGETVDVTVTATGGTAPYTGVGVSSVGSGTYYYSVTDANGCSVSDSITLVEPTLLTAYASCPVILCNGGTADVAVFAFGGTPTYTGTGVFNVGAGTYTYTVIDANGCTADVTITVTEPAELVASASSTIIDCFNGSTDITVTATGGTPPYSGNVVYTELAGTYTYTVTDLNGCTSDVTITVDQPDQIEANITPQNHTIDCVPIPVTLTANPTGGTGGPYTYLWSNGETTPSIEVNPNTTTTYTVEVTDANGCTVNTSTNGTTVNVLNRCGNNNQKVVICHVPPGNAGNPQTICISPNALNPHLSTLWDLHGGDYCGPCASSMALTTGSTDDGESTFIRAGINLDNESIELSYRIGYDSKVRLEIYDMAGTLVDVVHTAQANEGELYELKLNTNKISSGVYIYQFITDSETHIDKLQIIQ